MSPAQKEALSVLSQYVGKRVLVLTSGYTANVAPEGRAVSIRQMAGALRRVRASPDAEYPGWNWYPTPGHFILREFRRGLKDRINMRGANK